MGSGFKTFTAGAVLTASDVNNYLMEQGVMYFATTTARDTAITSPEDGMVAYIGSNDSSEGLYTYNGTAWRKGPGWNAPWGFIGLASVTTSQTGFGSVAGDITGLSVSWTAIANRRIKISTQVRAIQQGFSSNPEILITDSANAAVNKTTVLLAAGDRTTFTVFAVVTPSAGSVTYKARATTGIGTLDTEVSSTQPALFLVEDIGPAGAPA